MSHRKVYETFRANYKRGQWAPTDDVDRSDCARTWSLCRYLENPWDIEFYKDRAGRIIYYTFEGAFRKALELQELEQ